MFSRWRLALTALLLALVVGWFLSPGNIEADIVAFHKAPTLDAHLARFEKELGADYEGYRNHCLRVLSFALSFLRRNATERERFVIEAAIAYHDIALWTDAKVNYLEPSAARAEASLRTEEEGEGLSDAELRLVRDIIVNHHKLTDFRSEEGGAHDAIVNAVRKADWVDASLGLLSMGMTRANIQRVRAAIPNAGFHATLAAFGTTRVHGWNVPKALFELAKIFKL